MTEQIAHAFSVSVIATLILLGSILAAMLYLDGPAYRVRRQRRLQRALAGTRLHAVLIRRRIVPAEYAAAVGTAALALQVSRCRSCDYHQACDRTINCARGDPPILGCPNGAHILAACQIRGLRGEQSPGRSLQNPLA